MLVGLECPHEVLERVARVHLGVLDRLQDNDAPFERDGERRQLEVRAELATAFVDTGERPGERAQFNRLVVRHLGQRIVPALQAPVGCSERLADGVYRRVEPEGHAELALVEQDGRRRWSNSASAASAGWKLPQRPLLARD